MVTVCLTCGSCGFPEWLVYCSRCQAYALHRYCLDGPVNFDDCVTWFCENCETTVEKPSPLDKSIPLPGGTDDDLKPSPLDKSIPLPGGTDDDLKPSPLDKSIPLPGGTDDDLNLAKDETQVKPVVKNHKRRVKKWSHKKRKNKLKQKETTVEKPSPLDKSIPLPGGTDDDLNLAKDETQVEPDVKNHIKIVKKQSHKKKKNKLKQNETKDTSGFAGKRTVPSSDQGTSLDQNHIKRVKKNNLEQPKKIMEKQETENISGLVHETEVPSSDSSSLDQSQCCDNFDDCERLVKDCGPVLPEIASYNKESVSLENTKVLVKDDLNIVELDCCPDAQPVAEPIWRGMFFIGNPNIGAINGLVAHVSSLACSKVMDEAKLFPQVLHADLLQRSAVWPKGFKESPPTDESIALYILPESERDEKGFDKLVDDIICLDLAIRAVVENAELLVFPSTVLPTQYRRFQTKYYLWGVFRGKQV